MHASKKTTPAILSSQPTTPDTALRPHSSLVNDLLNTTDKDKISVLLLLDLSAAFDTIDHQIFLSCLETAFGIHSIAVQWFRSYLLDRNKCIVVNCSASSSSPLMFGVPQGSVLGPVLFVLYTTPFSDIIANHSLNHQLFADDTQLQNSILPNSAHSLNETCKRAQMIS